MKSLSKGIVLLVMVFFIGCGGGGGGSLDSFQNAGVGTGTGQSGDNESDDGGSLATTEVTLTLMDPLAEPLAGLEVSIGEPPTAMVSGSSLALMQGSILALESDPCNSPEEATDQTYCTDGNGTVRILCKGNFQNYYISKNGKLLDTGTLDCQSNEVEYELPNQDLLMVFSVDSWNDELVQHAIDPDTGELAELNRFPAGYYPDELTKHPTGNRLYLLNRFDNNISQFKISGIDGTVTEDLPRVPTGEWPFDLAINSAGSCLYVSNVLEGSISQYSVSAQGLLTEVLPRVSSPNSDTFTAIAISPDGNHVYAAEPGTHKIIHFTVDPQTCALSPGESIDSNFAVFSMDFNPNGKRIFTTDTDSNVILYHSVDAEGSLIVGASEYIQGSVPENVGTWPPPTSYAQMLIFEQEAAQSTFKVEYGSGDIGDFVVDPNGKFAYALDGYWMQIHTYRFEADCSLTPISSTPKVTTGTSSMVLVDLRPPATFNSCGKGFTVSGWIEKSIASEWVYY